MAAIGANQVLRKLGARKPATGRYRHPVPNEPIVNAFSNDIGPAALGLATGKREKSGERVLVEVSFPDEEPIRLEGVITWAKWVPPKLGGMNRGSIGVKITRAPEAWYRYFEEHDLGKAAGG